LNIPLLGRAGLKIRADDGCEELGFPEILSTPLFYQANPGDRLTLIDDAYKFNIATYRPEIEPRWIYTYAYAPDQSWTIYNKDLSGDSYRQSDYIFDKNTYFRVCLRKRSGESFDGVEDINKIIKFESTPVAAAPKPWLIKEVEAVVERISKAMASGSRAFLLMADTHYNVNGTWSDTQEAVKLISQKIKLDGIIHLGDMTDGMVSGDATRHYVRLVLDGLKSCGAPVWIALGNHDANYFRNNSEIFTIKEQRELYLDGGETNYFYDFPGLRLIFLDSFRHNEELRYGFSQENVAWLKQTLDAAPPSSKSLIFSHLPPLTRLQYWTKTIRGEEQLTEILKSSADNVLAWINGHNHADLLDDDEGYPIISIANAKCEAFAEHKVESFITPPRKLGEASQELFDIMIVNGSATSAHFIRFGAGEDKIISEGKAAWI